MNYNAMESPMIGTLVLIIVTVLAIHTAVRASAVAPTGSREAESRPAPRSDEQGSGPRSADRSLERSSQHSVDRAVAPSLENVAA
jgi:hypothetical protein